MKVSNCCGVPARGNLDFDLEDIGICSECKEHCEYVEEDEDEEEQKEFTPQQKAIIEELKKDSYLD